MEKKYNEKPKRFFWLKLPKSYFSHLEQKKMRRQEHGKDMQIIYLRMMLLGMDKGGYIYYQGVYDSIEEELAEEFDEPVEIVKETLEYLKDNNMVLMNENSDCFVPESLELTGSECSSAERVREYRNSKKMLQCNTEVTKSNNSVTSCNVEKDIDINKEKDNKNIMCKAEALTLFENLWKLYPVKKGKGQVSLSAKQRLLKVGYEEMVRAIDRYKADLERDSAWRKPQNGSTFFNSGYIDYLDKNYSNTDDRGNTQNNSQRIHNSFNDFQQNDYDIAELEKQILSN